MLALWPISPVPSAVPDTPTPVPGAVASGVAAALVCPPSVTLGCAEGPGSAVPPPQPARATIPTLSSAAAPVRQLLKGPRLSLGNMPQYGSYVGLACRWAWFS